jgi:SAM-dependent methyltransferase
MSLTPSIAAYWDAAADSFDEEADHGLRAPEVRAAWAARLDAWLPDPPADVLDLGCGTGSLSLVLAQRGHSVTGVDLSPKMAGHARRKLAVAGHAGRVLVADAGDPPLRSGSFDVVLVRHLLWTLPDPAAALRRFVTLGRAGGRLVLVEGRWNAGGDGTYVAGAGSLPWTGGVTAQTLVDTLRPLVTDVTVEPLTDPDLWGRPVDDERYALVAIV